MKYIELYGKKIEVDKDKSLVLSKMSIKDIADIIGLETLVNLKNLDLSDNQISEIKGLESLVNLQSLNLLGNPISEIKGLDTLSNLKELKIDLRHQYRKVWLNKGKSLNKIGRPADAIEWYNKILELYPEDIEALNEKGNAHLDLKNLDSAVECFDKVLKLEANNLRALIGKGVASLQSSELELSLDYFDKALLIDPHNSFVLNNKGTALNKLEKPEQALASFNEALKLNPNELDLLNQKSFTLIQMKKFKLSMATISKILEIDPNDKQAMKNKRIALEGLDHLRNRKIIASFESIERDEINLLRQKLNSHGIPDLHNIFKIFLELLDDAEQEVLDYLEIRYIDEEFSIEETIGGLLFDFFPNILENFAEIQSEEELLKFLATLMKEGYYCTIYINPFTYFEVNYGKCYGWKFL